jgi:hypothetical protein
MIELCAVKTSHRSLALQWAKNTFSVETYFNEVARSRALS